MKESDLIKMVNEAYEMSEPKTQDEIIAEIEAAQEKEDSGKAVYFSHEEAKRLLQPTSVRINPTLKVKIEAMARLEDRSFANMLNRLLESATSGY